jgi:heme/copper-type cytochrome/quinol oxidase subunit 1
MIRAIVEQLLLFLLPFAAFAIYLVIRRRNPLAWHSWSEQTFWLVVIGLGCVIAALLVTGITAERKIGAFEPTHVENGRVVPGQFR